MASLSENPEALYGDVIMEHYRSPRHRARWSVPTLKPKSSTHFAATGPTCN